MPMINGELIFNLMVLAFIILNINSDFNLGIEDGKLEKSRLRISELIFSFFVFGNLNSSEMLRVDLY